MHSWCELLLHSSPRIYSLQCSETLLRKAASRLCQQACLALRFAASSSGAASINSEHAEWAALPAVVGCLLKEDADKAQHDVDDEEACLVPPNAWGQGQSLHQSPADLYIGHSAVISRRMKSCKRTPTGGTAQNRQQHML